MKPAKIIVIAIAAVCAIGLAFVVRMMGSGSPASPASATAPAEVRPMARVLVARTDLAPGSRITDRDLEWRDWPVDGLNPTFITDGTVPLPGSESAEAPAATAEAGVEGGVEGQARTAIQRGTERLTGGGVRGNYIGAVVREAFVAGEPIVERKIVRAGDSGFLAAYLEPGMRAMAIRVNVETAAGGFILPGDRVDVILSRETNLGNIGLEGAGQRSRFTSATVLQNVKVLAIDQTTRTEDNAQSVIGATATLELSPRDAEALALARSEGELSLVLRSYADTAGPSGRVSAPRAEARAVRVYRNGETDVVVVP
ncbi:MAG: Flp pilus assembly protein CpaB [Brevundimonas sp.]|uniref:Flp pilus assembly protein CpaB n=1 Tax=Brevundimonas sp. TaxID=1871086 RepID=UPI00391A3F7E